MAEDIQVSEIDGKVWKLLEPIQVGSLIIKNRIVMPPM